MVYAYMPNFVSINLFCHPLVAKNPKFWHFCTLAFFWCHQLAVYGERWMWVHNYKPSPNQQYQNCFCIPMPSWWNHAHKLCHSNVWWTHKHTNKKLNVFGRHGGGWSPTPTKLGTV